MVQFAVQNSDAICGWRQAVPLRAWQSLDQAFATQLAEVVAQLAQLVIGTVQWMLHRLEYVFGAKGAVADQVHQVYQRLPNGQQAQVVQTKPGGASAGRRDGRLA